MHLAVLIYVRDLIRRNSQEGANASPSAAVPRLLLAICEPLLAIINFSRAPPTAP